MPGTGHAGQGVRQKARGGSHRRAETMEHCLKEQVNVGYHGRRLIDPLGFSDKRPTEGICQIWMNFDGGGGGQDIPF